MQFFIHQILRRFQKLLGDLHASMQTDLMLFLEMFYVPIQAWPILTFAFAAGVRANGLIY